VVPEGYGSLGAIIRYIWAQSAGPGPCMMVNRGRSPACRLYRMSAVGLWCLTVSWWAEASTHEDSEVAHECLVLGRKGLPGGTSKTGGWKSSRLPRQKAEEGL